MQPVVIGDVVWQPSAEVISRSRLQRLMDRHRIGSLAELQVRSVAEPEWFWDAVIDDLGVAFFRHYDSVMDQSAGVPWTRWFPGAEMNITQSCIDQWVHGRKARPDAVAVIAEGEPGDVTRLTYAELDREVGKLAAALETRLHVHAGDRVGLLLPMTAEVVIALMACAKIGAIAVPLFSGFGTGAIASRLNDAEASVLICADGFHRRGSVVPLKETADEALHNCPTVKHVIMHRRVGREVPWVEGRDHLWDVLTDDHEGHQPTRQLHPEHPLMLIYTSGTTGRPKGAVHVHGGFPIKAAQDMAHGFDVGRADTVFWLTDIGWMMGPWLIYGTLILGATMLLYEGTPDTPGPDRLWAMASRHGATVFGAAPTLVRSLMNQGDELVSAHDLSRLRILGSTGEAWNLEPWLWYFRTVGQGRIPIINYTGGTEISGGILSGNVLTPLRPCSFSGPVPGMAADVLDDAGQPVRGEVGELVIRAAWPGMTRGFWKDRERYEATYWARFPGTWVHGDWAYIDPADGLWYILGRSDDTIKVAGKRLGPAEVESVLVGHPAVREAAAVGVPDEVKGEALVCFCVLAAGQEASEALVTELKDLVASDMGKPLRPKSVLFVPDLPRTRNAKILRRVARAAYVGSDLGDLTSLENPDAVEAIRQLAAH